MVSMSRLRLRRKWQDSYSCRRQFFLFFFFCIGTTVFFKILKIVNEDEHRKEFHNSVSTGLNRMLRWLNNP